VEQQNRLASFEEAVIPHLDAAYNLARWLTRNDADAEDVAQEATLRAFRFFGGFHGGDGRAWFLTIVRNTCYTWLQNNRSREVSFSIDEQTADIESKVPSPEATLIQSVNREMVRHSIEELPLEYREVIVLREIEGLSYKEISAISEIPIGTVMSRLARARERLRQCLESQMHVEV
jgi:RNA polymerase sigma-70 factor (ECF subfamily)